MGGAKGTRLDCGWAVRKDRYCGWAGAGGCGVQVRQVRDGRALEQGQKCRGRDWRELECTMGAGAGAGGQERRARECTMGTRAGVEGQSSGRSNAQWARVLQAGGAPGGWQVLGDGFNIFSPWD